MSRPCKYGSQCGKLSDGSCTFFHPLDEFSSKRSRTDDMNYHNQYYEDKISEIENIYQNKLAEYEHIHQKTHDNFTKEIKSLKRKLKNSDEDYMNMKERFNKEHKLLKEKDDELKFVKSLLFEKLEHHKLEDNEYFTPVKEGTKLSFDS